MASLSSTSSIVDYLSLQGKDSSFSARKRLYEEMGLAERLGEYTGSASQNTNFLNLLRTPQENSSPYGMSTPTGPVTYNIGEQVGAPSPYGMSTPKGPVYYDVSKLPGSTGPTPDTETISSAQKQPEPPSTPTTPPQPTPTKEETTFGASDTLSTLGLSATGVPSADEALKKVMESPSYQLYLEIIGLKTKSQQAAAEAKKTSLEQQATQKAAEINQSYGQRGLYFSGMRSEDLKTLASSLATSKLGVDRDLAVNLLENDISVRNRIFTDVENIVKNAISEQGKLRTEALGQLNKMGYAWNPIDNSLVKIADTNDPTSFKEWSLAGGEEGTGQTYAEWLKKESGGFTPAQLQSAFDRVADDFRQDPITKQYTTAGTGASFLRAINVNTTNPADDIGMIYAFAKIMDPESVVREGEYATVQRYAQAWAETFGFNAQRIFSNEKFLTSQALSNMKATALAKFKSISQAYDTARLGYEQRISNLQAGNVTGNLPSYDFGGSSTGPSLADSVRNAGYDYDKMRADGLTDKEIKEALNL